MKTQSTDWHGRALLGCILLFALAAWPGSPLSASTEDSKTGALEVTVEGLKNDKGVVVVALLNSQAMYDAGKETFREAKAPIRDGRASVTFEDLPYGGYAAKTFHDENSNGKLDTNFVGYPKEGFGFSNDAMGRFGPPGFEAAKFYIGSDELRIEINSK